MAWQLRCFAIGADHRANTFSLSFASAMALSFLSELENFRSQLHVHSLIINYTPPSESGTIGAKDVFAGNVEVP